MKIEIIKRQALFGLLTWYVVVKEISIGELLKISMDRVPEDVYINGVKYFPKES